MRILRIISPMATERTTIQMEECTKEASLMESLMDMAALSCPAEITIREKSSLAEQMDMALINLKR